MDKTAAIVDRTLRASGIPIVGVTIGHQADRATWNVVFDPSATPAQKASAAVLVLNTPVDAPAQAAQDSVDAQTQVDGFSIAERAPWLALLDQINVIRSKLVPPLTAITVAQVDVAIRNKAGGL